MLLKNLETELQHTTFDGTCLTFYTMMLGWDFSPMNVQLPETLKKVIQQYLISWMFHNTVCGEGTPIHKTLLIWKYVFRIPKTCDFTPETLGANPQGPCFNCFQLPRRLFQRGPGPSPPRQACSSARGKSHRWSVPRMDETCDVFLEEQKNPTQMLILNILSLCLETHKIAKH